MSDFVKVFRQATDLRNRWESEFVEQSKYFEKVWNLYFLPCITLLGCTPLLVDLPDQTKKIIFWSNFFSSQNELISRERSRVSHPEPVVMLSRLNSVEKTSEKSFLWRLNDANRDFLIPLAWSDLQSFVQIETCDSLKSPRNDRNHQSSIFSQSLVNMMSILVQI